MDGSWFAPVSAYCERLDPSFWAEPLNAVSNAAFLVAAGAAALRERMAVRRDPAAVALAGLVAVVGIGSFLFHTLANRWSLLADVIPIALFIYAYLFLALRRFFGWPVVAAIIVTIGFAGFNIGFTPALEALTGYPIGMFSNGSVDYVPAVLALLGVCTGLLLAARPSREPARASAGRGVLAIGAVFLVSLALRTLDNAACPEWPSGTHFLWHLLNAVVLYGLIATAIRFRERA